MVVYLEQVIGDVNLEIDTINNILSSFESDLDSLPPDNYVKRSILIKSYDEIRARANKLFTHLDVNRIKPSKNYNILNRLKNIKIRLGSVNGYYG